MPSVFAQSSGEQRVRPVSRVLDDDPDVRQQCAATAERPPVLAPVPVGDEAGRYRWCTVVHGVGCTAHAHIRKHLTNQFNPYATQSHHLLHARQIPFEHRHGEDPEGDARHGGRRQGVPARRDHTRHARSRRAVRDERTEGGQTAGDRVADRECSATPSDRCCGRSAAVVADASASASTAVSAAAARRRCR